MKKQNIKYLVFLMFSPLLAFAQVENVNGIDKYFSKNEKTAFERALVHQNTFYNRIFPDLVVDFSELQIFVTNDVNELGNIIIQKKISGYYSSSDRKLVICKTEKFKDTYLQTAFHELSHALLHLYSDDRFDQIHPWLNEGLASYLQEMTYRSKKITHKKNNYMIARVQTLLSMRDIDLVDFVNWNHQRFAKESFSQEGYGYAVSYCMALLLMTNKDEKSTYSLFRILIEEDISTIEAFDKYYEGGFSQFEKDFVNTYSK